MADCKEFAQESCSKDFVMIWYCVSSKGVGIIGIMNEMMIKEVYFNILKYELIVNIKKFSFIDPIHPNY